MQKKGEEEEEEDRTKKQACHRDLKKAKIKSKKNKILLSIIRAFPFLTFFAFYKMTLRSNNHQSHSVCMWRERERASCSCYLFTIQLYHANIT